MSGSAYYIRKSEIEEAIGREAAGKLMAELGGRKFYMPERPRPDDPVIQAIGQEAANRFAAYISTGIGGLFIEIPLAGGSSHNIRVSRLRQMLKFSNKSTAEIAKELGLTERNVRRTRAKLRDEARAGQSSGASIA